VGATNLADTAISGNVTGGSDGLLLVAASLAIGQSVEIGKTLSVGQNFTVAGDAFIVGTLNAGSFAPNSLNVPGAVQMGSTLSVTGVLSTASDASITGTLNAGDIATSGSVSCRDDATSRIDVCSVSDGKNRGPSIDATTGGATKFHVGGVLKVKVSDEGVAIFGSTSFTGSAVFNGNATFHGDAVFNGNVTFNAEAHFSSLSGDATSLSLHSCLFTGAGCNSLLNLNSHLSLMYKLTSGRQLTIQNVEFSKYLQCTNGGTVATTGTLTAEDRLKFMISPMKGHHVILCAEDSWNRVLYYDGTDIASYVTDAYVGMAKFSIYIPELKSNGDPWSYTDAVVIRNVWQNKYLSCNSNGDLSFVANYGDAEAWTISIKDYA